MNDRTDLNFAGRRLDEADFTGARLHGAILENVKITDSILSNADISGEIDGLRLNGVEVAAYVETELDSRFPERKMLRAGDPEGMREAWVMLESVWQGTVSRARALPEVLLVERVDQEWSFIETLRHLILATDCWLRRMVLQQEYPYHPWGLAGAWLTAPTALGLDPMAHPSLEEVLTARREHTKEVRRYLESVSAKDLDRTCVPPTTPGHPTAPASVRHCLQVILREEWLHSTYANRDLQILEDRTEGVR